MFLFLVIKFFFFPAFTWSFICEFLDGLALSHGHLSASSSVDGPSLLGVAGENAQSVMDGHLGLADDLLGGATQDNTAEHRPLLGGH